MKLGTELALKQSQRLVMTNDLRQSIELLSLSTLELADKIQNELMENPLLDEITTEEKPKTPELFSIEEVRRIEKINHEKSTDINWQESYSIDGPKGFDPDAGDRNQKFLESSSKVVTLEEHLLSQLRLMNLTKGEFATAEILLSMLDEHGFINQNIPEIAKEFKVSEARIKKVLKLIQELDPVGVGTKNITETLLVQARVLYPHNSVLTSLIKNHIGDLEKFDYKKIAKYLNIMEEDVSNLARLVKRLQPYPASLFQTKKPDYVVPDVLVKEVSGEFNVFINDEWLPKLSVHDEYKEMMNTKLSPVEREYFQTKLSSAQWIIKSIQQRRHTLHRVVSCIIDFQIEFFRSGIVNMRPLTLKDIAEKLSLHESTISRITTNKYVQTTWGIFELKWFFSSGVKSLEGGKESSKKIQEMIKTLVKEEKAEEPLSDQEIVDHMQKKGIEIARRTVAKYRKILKILPFNQRKRANHLNS